MKKMIKNSQKREKSEKNSFIANSVIKKYIEGGINANDIKNNLRRKQSECDYENNNRKNVLGYNKATNLTNSIKKRMTLGPEHFKALNNLGNNFFINKYNDNSLDFENIKKFDNYINEEKDEDYSYMKNYRYNSDKIKKEMNNRNDGLKLYEDLCIYKGNKSLDKKKENDKRSIIYLKINNNTPKSSTKKEIININEKDRNNNYDMNSNKEVKKNLKTISNFNINKNLFPKILNPLNPNNNTKSDLFKILNNNTIKEKSQSAISNKYNFEDNNSILNNRNIKTSRLTNSNKYGNNFHDIDLLNKLNVIELNFKESKSLVNQRNNEKKRKKIIKEGKINISTDKNNASDNNSNSFKKILVDNSDLIAESKSSGKFIINNNSMGDNSNNNIMVKEGPSYNNSFGYIEFIKKNRINLKRSILKYKKKSYLNHKVNY